jgi:ABC-type transport system involved in multi-copper enzyme maturation permease subunit
MPLGLGPVFAYERLTSARRWQTYAFRSFVVAALLVAMAAIAATSNDFGETPAQRYARLGEAYFNALIGVELALVMLAAPAATAGAICLDRARGTLAHVLATDLTDPEIVLGKLAARLLPVLGVVAATWPVMAICTLLGGIDPFALALAMAIIVTVALLGCALALALSVWARKPHEVILTTYTFWALVMLAWPIWSGLSQGRIIAPPGRWLLLINPFYLAFAPYAAPGRVGFWDYAWVFAAALACSATLVWLAVWRMRAVACCMAGEVGRDPALGAVARLRRWLPGPSLEGNPVLWREWHRARPSAWMTWLVVLVGGSTGLACIIGAVGVWRKGVIAFAPAGPAQMAGIAGYLLQGILGLLMLSAVAPLSLSEERQRGSLDVLSATPLSTWSIVLAKWWGTFRIVPVLALAPGLMGLALATARRPAPPPAWVEQTQPIGLGYRLCGAALLVATMLAHGAALTSIGLALATWVKRQSRAIAASVSAFVVLAAALPILMSVLSRGPQGWGLSFLSPVSVSIKMAEELVLRLDRLPGLLWWIGLWDVAIAALAVSLLWFTGRTFDEAFGRMREQARKPPALADAVVALASTSGAACLYVALTIWNVGIYAQELYYPGGLGAWFCILLLALGLLLLSAVAPLSICAEHRENGVEFPPSAPRAPRAFVLTTWWRIFRLVPLLALGPGLIALSLATAPKLEDYTRCITPAPVSAGAQVIGAARAVPMNRPALWEPRGVDRLVTAAGLVSTILVHGAAIISLGLALSAWIKRENLAIAASIGVFGMSALIYPLASFFGDPALAVLLCAPSAITISSDLMASLLNRGPRFGSLLLETTVLWNVATAVLAVGFLWLAIRGLERRAGAGPMSFRPVKARCRFARRTPDSLVPRERAVSSPPCERGVSEDQVLALSARLRACDPPVSPLRKGGA